MQPVIDGNGNVIRWVDTRPQAPGGR
jgi:hypothetical protein